MTEAEYQAAAPDQKVRTSYLPHVARGALINFSGIFARMAFIYAYTFMLARLMPVDQVGQYFLMLTIVSLSGLAAVAGLDYGVVRFVAVYAGEGRLDRAQKALRAGVIIALPVGFFFMAVVVWQAPLLGERFLDSASGSVTALRVFAIAIPLLVLARLFNSTTQGLHQMRYQVYSRDVGEQILKLGLTGMLLAIGGGLLAVVFANLVALAIATAMSLYFAMMLLLRKREVPLIKPVDKGLEAECESPARAMLRYSYPLALSNVLVALWIQMDTLMLGLLGTTEDVGYYGVALKISLFGAKIITAFAVVFTPIIADLWNRGRLKELSQLYTTISRWIFALSFPLFLIMVLFSQSLMKIFGAGYVAGGGALVLLAFGQLMSASTGAAGIMVLMSGRSKLELLNVATTLITDALLCYLLIPHYGVDGAAIANMTSLGLVNVMRIVEIWFIMHMFAYDRSYLKPLAAGVGAAMISYLIGRFVLDGTGVVQLGVVSLTLIVAYFGAIVMMGLDENDKSILRNFGGRAVRPRTT